MRKNSTVTKNLVNRFDDEVSEGILVKEQAFTHAIFYNYTEIETYLSERRNGSKIDFKNSTLLEIHANLFRLVKFFCEVARQNLTA